MYNLETMFLLKNILNCEEKILCKNHLDENATKKN